MSKDNSDPAFPVEASEYGGHGTCFGMSLRDYFAAKAMQGLCVEAGKGTIVDVVSHIELCAALSFRISDAMLAERAK